MRILLLLTGVICLSIGISGIFIPGLPTTPFLLLASYFFVRSSPRLHLWLINHKYFGGPLRDFAEKKGVSKKTKIIAISLMSLMILFSVFLFLENLYLKIIVVFAGITGAIVVLKLKTIKESEE